MTAAYPEAQVLYRPIEYARVKDSIEFYGRDRASQQEFENNGGRIKMGADGEPLESLPDVWRYRPFSTGGKPDFILMSSDVQHWIFRINVERYIGRRMSDLEYDNFWRREVDKHRQDGSALITEFTRMWRKDGSHSNYAGFNADSPRANYIAQTDLTHEPPKWQHIVTGGFVGKLADDRVVTLGGVQHYGLRCINIGEDYTQYHPFTHPYLFDQPAVTGRDVISVKGGWEIVNYWRRVYPWFGGQVVIPFALPYDSVAYIPVGQLIIPSDQEPLRK